MAPIFLARFALFVLVLFASGPLRADWRSDANASIEQIRKRDWVVQVRDTNNQPVIGATIQVRQRRHQFAFGSALNSYPLVSEPRYGEFFARNFEWAVFENETKWASNEPVQGQVTYKRADLMAAFCRKHGITMRGHTIFWEANQNGYEQPAWLAALNTNQVRAAVEARLESVVPHFRGMFEHWDINNEMLHGNFFRGRLGAGIVPYMFQRTGVLDPNAKRFVNDYNVIAATETAAYRSQITNLLATGAAVEGIGAQGHFGGQIVNPTVVKSRLDLLSTTGIPIWITEYDSVNTNVSTRADNLETLYRVAFAHTNVQGVLMWGFWAGAHWMGSNAAIVDLDWKLNAAGQRYTNLIHEWTTVTNGVTDGSGQFRLRGYHGGYDVAVISGTVTNIIGVTLAAGSVPQTNQVVVTTNRAGGRLAGKLINNDVMRLDWERSQGAASYLVEASSTLANWQQVSPRLGSLAQAWTAPATNAAAQFFRVRPDSVPLPDLDFVEATGGRRVGTINAAGQLIGTNSGVISRDYFFFASGDLRNGVISLTEDPMEASPSGGPAGVLKFRIDTKPTTVGQEFWGIILRLGSIPEWPGTELTTTPLSKTRLSFRYKLTAGRNLNVRLEPNNAGYNERCDFGNVTGNDTWQEFNRLFSTGANVTSFLNSLNTTGERQLRVIVASGGGLATYASGDTLLLDDISIHYEL